MFERFTQPNKDVVVAAQDYARSMKHNYIGTEHLLLALLASEESLASVVLNSLGVTLAEVEGQVKRIVGQGDEANVGQLPFTPRAKKVLELSLREALSLGHNYIGPEHTLLGLVRVNAGVAARVLLDFDVDDDKIRNEVIRAFSSSAADRKKVASEVGKQVDDLATRLGKLKDDQLVTVVTAFLTEATTYLRNQNRKS